MPPSLDRRQFLQLTGAAAIGGALARRSQPPSPRRIRVAVLLEPGFPAIDTSPLRPDVIGAAVDGFDTTYLAVGELADRLTPERFDVYVNPYGSALPKDAWPTLLRYLGGGGNWINCGGVPCAVPVARSDGGWKPEARQTEYHHRLGVTLACPVAAAAVTAWRADMSLPWTQALSASPPPSGGATTVWELYYRLSSVADSPDESGSAGPREAVVRPLLSGYDADGRAIAAPFVMLDRLEREFAGGRWIFVTSDAGVEPAALRALIVAASLGSRLFEVRPSLACYRGGERPAIAVSFRGFPPRAAGPLTARCHVGVYDERGNSLSQSDVEVSGTEAVARGSADLGAALPDPLGPGLYRIEAVLTLPGEPPLELRHTTGFWVWDPVLLAGGPPLGRGEHALTRNGEPYVVTGTTYMASDVHRKFLLQPNPWLWDRDFAAMKRAGVNLVRTGIWTGWRILMPSVGQFDQAALRALDAFLLTARRYDIPVIFTYFAFLPETWGGENAYLDPAALEAQRAFVTAIAGRYGAMNDLLHDLINEPSFCNKDHLWSCRPNYDRFERDAWAAWISERWDAAARAHSSVELPRLEEFAEGAAAADGATPKVLEYRLFAQAMFARWVRAMAAAVRASGTARQLVTVGQDEGGTRDSPNNLFLGSDLDFTTNHTWWLNDALVWDGVITKVPGKVNLIEETGVMFSGRPAGVDSRWEEYARNLLERKMAVAVGPGGAGFVEWLWNSNCYMPSDNEAAIGLLRADGAAKPELAALRGVAEFVAAAQRYLVGREDERVLMVVPHSNMFSVRNTATDATKMAVRVMQYRCRVGMAAVSEYAVTPAMRAPRLVVVPAPQVLRQDAWEGLLAWARRGALVLVTGPIDRDERGNRVERLERLGIRGPDVAAASPRTISLGLGAVLWSPQPAESSNDPEATAVLYRWALAQAGIEPAFSVDGADASILVHAAAYQSCVLFTLVSENPRTVTVHLHHRESHQGFDVVLPPERAALLLVGRTDGRLIGSYQPA